MNNNYDIAEFDRTMYLNYRDWDSIHRQQRNAYFQKMQYERTRRASYYKRQRSMGFMLLLVAMTVLIVACVNAFAVLQGVGVVVALFGLYTMLTRQMVLVDSYYLECMDKINLN